MDNLEHDYMCNHVNPIFEQLIIYLMKEKPLNVVI